MWSSWPIKNMVSPNKSSPSGAKSNQLEMGNETRRASNNNNEDEEHRLKSRISFTPNKNYASPQRSTKSFDNSRDFVSERSLANFILQKAVREDMVLKGINFLLHPKVRDDVETHTKFLRMKGLTELEIQEVIKRTHFKDDLCNDYDPIYLMPAVFYEEFLFKLRQPQAANVLKRFKRYFRCHRN